MQYNNNEYHLKRYPKTEDKSLRAWSSAELLVLNYITNKESKHIYLFNDRFGVWNCALKDKNLTTVWTYASQKKAITQNLQLNNFSDKGVYKTPLENLGKVDMALIKIPKSLDLFELFLQQIHRASSSKTKVICGFMTKYFSASYLKIAEQYFNIVEQTKAWKKARLLILKEPKNFSNLLKETNYMHTVLWKGNILKQYYGVFSSNKIDIGTHFFLEHLQVEPKELDVLDLASGNGIIAWEVIRQNSKAQVTLIDDFNLAIASSQVNVTQQKAKFICADNLDGLEQNSFDLVVSNPPFHFEHENNMEITLHLFKGVQNCLKENGRFVLVANKHLNYTTHLNRVFSKVSSKVKNKKFEILECRN